MELGNGNDHREATTKAITFESGGIPIRLEYKVNYARQHIAEAKEAHDRLKKTRSISKTGAPAIFLSEALVSLEDGGESIPITLEALQMQSLYLLGTIVNRIEKDLSQ